MNLVNISARLTVIMSIVLKCNNYIVQKIREVAQFVFILFILFPLNPPSLFPPH